MSTPNVPWDVSSAPEMTRGSGVSSRPEVVHQGILSDRGCHLRDDGYTVSQRVSEVPCSAEAVVPKHSWCMREGRCVVSSMVVPFQAQIKPETVQTLWVRLPP